MRPVRMLSASTIAVWAQVAVLGLAGTVPSGRAAAQAGPTASPDRTSASFGDWTVQCAARPADAPAGTPARSCEMTQSVQDSRGQIVAQFAIARPMPGQNARWVAVLPVNVTLTTPPRILADEGATAALVTLTLRACGPRGCVADAELRDEAMRALRLREGAGRLVFLSAAGAEVALPVSFRGFGQARDALEREAR